MMGLWQRLRDRYRRWRDPLYGCHPFQRYMIELSTYHQLKKRGYAPALPVKPEGFDDPYQEVKHDG